MRRNNNIKYTYKQIGVITFPILISLLMEMMIGVTDTAFLGRVGEIELGASAISGVFYIYGCFRFQCRSSDSCDFLFCF